MSSSLDQTLSSSFVSTSTFPSGTSISSIESTSTRAFGDATVVGTSATAVLACNSIAIVACVFVLVAYVCLYQKHRLLMRRTSLTLSCAMAVSGLLLHATNLVRYLNPLAGFACAFFGGWMYAFPTLLSIFYSSCIALHSQLYFVFQREPKDADKGIYAMLKWYLILPIAASGVICTTALSLGFYGYSSIWGHCWYASLPNDPSFPALVHERTLISITTTFTGWCVLAVIYLLITSITISYVVFWKGSSDVDFGDHIGLRRNRKRYTSEGSASNFSSPENCWVGTGPISSMDGSTICEGRLDRVKSGAQEAPLFSPPVAVKHIGEEDISCSLEPSDDEGATGNIRASVDDNRGPNEFPFPPKVYLDPPSCPSTLQLQGLITSARNPTQMTPTLPGFAHHLPSQQESSRVQCSSHAQDRPRKVSRRTLRAVALRLIGYILIPVFCIFPCAITDLIILCSPTGGVVIPDSVSGILNALNGLIGLFNALLFFSDPVLLVVWARLWANRSWGVLYEQTSTSAGSYRGRGARAEESRGEMYPLPSQNVNTSGSEQVGSLCDVGENEGLSQRPASIGRLEEAFSGTRRSTTLEPRSSTTF